MRYALVAKGVEMEAIPLKMNFRCPEDGIDKEIGKRQTVPLRDFPSNFIEFRDPLVPKALGQIPANRVAQMLIYRRQSNNYHSMIPLQSLRDDGLHICPIVAEIDDPYAVSQLTVVDANGQSDVGRL